ncbi:MAG: hypothetical protein H8D87_04855, partial [Deltaproteobacteria bacterium]|nr:hypothetical protein [Candidatus Desulfobacula maris]
MKEKEWYSLDDDTKSKLIDLSFVDQVTTDPDWKKTPDDEKIALYDLYRKEADDFNIQSKPKPKDYGLVGDLAQGGLAAAKGVAGGMRMTDLDPEEEKNPVAKLGKYLSDLADVAEEKYDIFKPQARDDGFLMEGLRGTAQSIPASLTPFAGALAGGAVGGPIGAVIGGMGTLFGTFFAGTYQNTYEDAVEELEKKGIPEEKIHGIANKHALKSSSLEFGTELAGDLAAVTFFGLLGKNAVKNGIKSTIKELAGPGGAKKFLSAYAKTVPFEMGSEMVAGYGQAKSAQEAGLLTPSPGESAKQAIIPSILMPLLFGAGIHGADAYKAKSLYNDLNSEDKEKRFDAANKIAGRLDPEERKVWYETATEFIGQGKEIPLSKPIVDFASINAIRKGSASVEFLNKISDGLKSGSVTKDQVESLKSDRRFLEFSDQIDTILSDHETKNPSITDATTSDDAVNRFNQIINNALGGGPQKLDTGILSSIQRKRSELDNYLEEEGYNQSFDSEFEKRKKAAQYAGREVSRVEDIINTFKTTTDFKVRDQSQREINALFSEGVPFNEGLAELEKNIAEFKKHRSVEALERRQAKMSDQATKTTTDKEFIQAQTDIRNGKFVPLEIMERHPSLLPEGETLLKGISVEDRREASVRALERRQANMKGLQVGILNIPSINREDKKPAKADTAIQEGVEGEVVSDTQSLEAEAKNHKSADEFVESHAGGVIKEFIRNKFGNSGATFSNSKIQDYIDKLESSMYGFDRYSAQGRNTFKKVEQEIEELSTIKNQGFETLKDWAKPQLTDIWNKANPQEKPTTPAEGKEPWEISRKEYDESEEYIEEATGRISEADKIALNSDLSNPWTFSSHGGKNIRFKSHRKIVQKAIQDGKIDSHPDYPDLSQLHKDSSKTEPKSPDWRTKDTELETVEDISSRIKQIEKQIEKLEAVVNPANFDTHHNRIKKLNERKDRLWGKRAGLLKKDKKPEVVKTYTNKEDGVQSIITKGLEDGKYHVVFKDIDSGNILSTAYIFPKLEDAISKANEIFLKGEDKPIGKNQDGQKIYQDKNGVRSYEIEPGYLSTQPVSIVPGGQSTFDSPKTLFIKRKLEYLTDEEIKEFIFSDKKEELPEGWTEASPGGMATNQDPISGGIVDSEIKSGKWFVIPNNDNISKMEGFETREEALDALKAKVSEEPLKQKITETFGDGFTLAVPGDKNKVPGGTPYEEYHILAPGMFQVGTGKTAQEAYDNGLKWLEKNKKEQTTKEKMVDFFTTELRSGKGFKHITAARKAVSESLGIEIKAGTQDVKTVDEAIEIAGVNAAR